MYGTAHRWMDLSRRLRHGMAPAALPGSRYSGRRLPIIRLHSAQALGAPGDASPAQLSCLLCCFAAPDDFDKIVKGDKHALVEFYAPWYVSNGCRPGWLLAFKAKWRGVAVDACDHPWVLVHTPLTNASSTACAQVWSLQAHGWRVQDPGRAGAVRPSPEEPGGHRQGGQSCPGEADHAGSCMHTSPYDPPSEMMPTSSS